MSVSSVVVYVSDFGEDWPLDKKQLQILDGNRNCLVILINPTTAFTNQLLEKEVISVREKDFIASKAIDFDKNEALLDILRRTSKRNYRKAINCLQETYQDRIANILLMQGGKLSVFSRNLFQLHLYAKNKFKGKAMK